MIAKRFYLGGGLNATVGDDLLDHSKPVLNALDMHRILRRLLGRLTSDQLTHPFLVLQPALEGAVGEAASDREADDQSEEAKNERIHESLL